MVKVKDRPTEQPSGLPPAQDLKALIRQEHKRAELQRLDEGMDGCGCSDCQELYKTLDLSKYGNRVTNFGDTVLIGEKWEVSKSAASVHLGDDRDTPQTDCLPLPAITIGVSKLIGGGILLPTTKDSPKKVVMKHHGGRPRKQGKVSKVTLWRRNKQGRGGFESSTIPEN